MVLGTFSETEPFRIKEVYQVSGGLKGIYELFETTTLYWRSDVIICEKFIPRPNPGGGGLTLKTVEPLRIEGWLVAAGYMPDYKPGLHVWRQPSQQYLGGDTVKEKRKNVKKFLKKIGLYYTGSQLEKKDSDDVISATMHAINFLRDEFHTPTLEAYFK